MRPLSRKTRNVSMAALWMFDSNNAELLQLGFDIAPTNSRSYQLNLLQEYIARIVLELAS
ncbi:MAG TPA: hypothetical protein VGN72_00120 [Tepidisphaeraceae bacterium]|nr:hypothetical protein [Tepidisphaeraceae bacterium]